MHNTIEESYELPPGQFGLPFIGESIEWLINPNFFQTRHAKYGNIFKTNLFSKPTVVLIGHEGNKFLFENEGKYFSDGMNLAVPTSTKRLMGSGSLVMQMGDEHKKNRRIVYKAFQTNSLEEYIPIIEFQSKKFLERWRKKKIFRWHNEFKDYSLAIAMQAFLDINENNTDSEFSELYKKWGDGLLSFPIDLPFTRFGQALRCRELLLEKIGSIITERQKENSGKDLLSLILKNSIIDESLSLNHKDIQEQVLTLVFAGHDTLSSALTSFFQLISLNPKIKVKLYEELVSLEGINSLTGQRIKEMTYLDQVTKEVFRFSPPTSGTPRKVLQDCYYRGYKIPQDWNILYNIGQTQKDESVYLCPHQFNPENFSTSAKKPALSYIPFGGGSRECIGKDFAILELKILAIYLIRGYDWKLISKQSYKKILLPALHPKDGLKVMFWKRE